MDLPYIMTIETESTPLGAVPETGPPRRALFWSIPGVRRGAEGAAIAAEALEGGGIELVRGACDDAGHLRDTIREQASSFDMIVLGGGDGTMNAAAPALLETGLPLGILPLGTANDLARTLGIPTELKRAARGVIGGWTRRIDLGEVNGHPFFNVASIGLSVEVTRELTLDLKRRWGRLGYALATGRALWNMRPFRAEIRHDGEVRKVQTLRRRQRALLRGRHGDRGGGRDR